VVLFHRKVIDVAVVRKWQRAQTISAAYDSLVVDAVGRARPRSPVFPIALHADILRNIAVTGDVQRVRGHVVIRKPALVDQTNERRVVLVAHAEIDRQLRCHGPFVLDEREERPETDAGIGHLEIAPDQGRLIEEERREQIREAAVRGGIARERRLSSAELELAARAALILRLQQKIARMTEILAELDRVVAL